MLYTEVLETKKRIISVTGFEVTTKSLNKKLFEFQKFIVQKALRYGRYAIFGECGTGKTPMQLEWANKIVEFSDGWVLILCPLAVKGQTILEGKKFRIYVQDYFEAEDVGDLVNCTKGILIANYEQIDNINVSMFKGIVLDESSILKNFTGIIKRKIIAAFKNTPYKLCCTATPAPNDLNEIGNHSEFLGILDAQDMRSKWFIRDEGMNNYRLKGHAKTDFFAWISSWATMLVNPADIGFAKEGKKFKLPKLNLIEKQIQTEHRDNGKLYNDISISATTFQKELRITKVDRLSEVVKLVKRSKENFIIWVSQDEEADYLMARLPKKQTREVRGSHSAASKEKNLLDFAKGEYRILVTKRKIAQFGLNFQNCHNQVFPSLDFSFEGLYQAIRRSYRFGQKHDVNAYIFTTDTMQNVVNNINIKEKNFIEMQTEMNKNINEQKYGLKDQYDFKEVRNDSMWLMKGDSTIEWNRIENNSIDFMIFSPPFSSLFTYSNYIHDMGNNESHADFFRQYKYLLDELYRTLKPGRLMACHTKNLGVYKNSSGFTGMYDFTGDHTKAVLAAGFKLHCVVTIWTDPVLEMQRTKTQRLLYKQVTSDSTYSGTGMQETIHIFRKWDGDEDNWTPVTSLNKNNFPLDDWQQWASPAYRESLLSYEKHDLVKALLTLKAENFRLKFGANAGLPESWYDDVWYDIKRTDVLNNREGTAQGDEKHIAPLQLEVIRRLVMMFSNRGEKVATCFGGIGSEPYVSLQEGRYAIACELKDSYFDVMVSNCKKILAQQQQLSLI